MSARFEAVPVKVSAWLKVLLLVVSLIMLLPLYFGVQTLWGAANLGYRVTGDALQIQYAWTRHSIPLSEITAVDLVQPTRLSRIAGSNAPGLYAGRWTSKETGRIILFATRLDSLVVVRTSSEAWGLTPADPAALQAAILSRTPAEFAVRPGGASPLLVVLPLLLVLTLIPGTWWILRLIYRFPKALTYELGPSALVIETGWRPVRVPYNEIESVAETTVKGWPMRVYGSELKGVHWGLFSWSAVPGKRIHLYATQLKPIVLIRAGKRSFGLSPADAAGFVRALQERIGR